MNTSIAALALATSLLSTPAFAGDVRPASPELGRAIAEQGNRALAEIRADTHRAAQKMAPPALPVYAALPVSLKLAQTLRTLHMDRNS